MCVLKVQGIVHKSKGSLEKTLFHKALKISAKPLSRSLLSSEITSMAFWFKNRFKLAPGKNK